MSRRVRDLPLASIITLATFTLAFSMFVLSNNTGYQRLNEMIGRANLGVGVDVLVIGTFLVILVAGLMDRRQLSYLYLLSATVLAPSLLGLSKVDWFLTMGSAVSVSDLSSVLPDWIILVNGALVIGGYFFQRGVLRSMSLGEGLLGQGAREREVAVAVNSNLAFLGIVVAVTGAMAVAVGAVAGLLLPFMRAVVGLGPDLYLVMTAIAGVALVGLFFLVVIDRSKGLKGGSELQG